nr:aminomethyl-transferring glycine dehydrogenase subunit GcvPA [Candidatus Sigynarchaeota archaeon]
MDYIPHAESQIKFMMEKVGVKRLADLFDTIPRELLLDDERAKAILKSGALADNGMTELELKNLLAGLASKNKAYKSIFQGAGSYWHYIPAVVDYLTSRGELWTSYTPYQAERSQGYLQAIFEYQSMIAAMTGMNFSNASLHDGATALVDAIVMAKSQNKDRDTVVIAGKINPFYKTVVATALMPRDIKLICVEPGKLAASIDGSVMAIIACSPDFFGTIHDVAAIVQATKQKDNSILVIQCITEALSLAMLKSPGAAGVDIAVGEAQSLGIPMCFGGPALGFLAVSDSKLLHKMPGRIVGCTKEVAGERLGFTLTLSAREQHIRREKALSNICSNEALNMLRAAIYMAALGGTGLKQVATINVKKANYLKAKLCEIKGFTCINEGPTFNEFVMKKKDTSIQKIIKSCESKDILGPLDLGTVNIEWKGLMLFCATEMNESKAIDDLIASCKEGIA